MSEWTFLTNHSLVLSLISRHSRITGLELSREVGITERAVRKVIADLETAGYIEKNKEGRCIRYRINPDLTLRHKSYQEIAIGDFLETLGWKVEK
jgi:predicted transcriptional regulator